MNAQSASRLDAALESLEFADVLDAIAACATSAPGREAVLALRPHFRDRARAHQELELVDDAAGFLQAGGDIAFAGAVDTSSFIERAEKGSALSAVDLRSIADSERALRAAVAAVRADTRPAGVLRALASRRQSTDDLISSIDHAIEPEGRVADAASTELSSIRRQQRGLHEQVRERCRTITLNPELSKMLSEPIVTVRAGRYVVPVRSEFASHFPGVVHDQSASGATVFMEPLASVEANNKLRGLQAAEEREVARILAALSARVGELAEPLRMNAELLAGLDSIGARARWGIARDAGPPALVDEPIIRVVRGRHPLLRREAVPLDFEIGDAFDAVVVSGPNMGGKTVVLKTVGLFCLLAYAGIPLPAAAGTTIGEFADVACVIGDEQSIQNDLSSFSSHLAHLRAAMSQLGRRSLVLVDEIGSGTEPTAGAALAQAWIEHAIRAGARVVVTTHYTQLKTFAAQADRVRNASMLFNPDTHAPTYVFALGIPGQSLAFALARTMALDARLIARAEALVGVDAQNLESTFARLAQDREALQRERRDVEQMTATLHERDRSMRQRIAALEQEKLAFERRASAELAAAVQAVRDQLVAEAERRSDVAARQAAKPLPQSERLLADTLAEMRRSLGLESAPAGAEPRGLHIGDNVYVRSFDQSGVVSEVYSREVLVTLGNVKTLVPIADVSLAPGAPPKNAHERSRPHHAGPGRPQSEAQSAAATATTEVDVRGMRVDDAWPLVDKALDNASLAGLSELRVIHGRGTGQLMRGIREFLDGHPQVVSVSHASDREGGTGVTVVKLA
ncbi:MAG: Smr/MutS family protein [Candidatus Eremiobacteraeota bacterium]|nr:Smr/MutS family protein [Candidatus Eremiobacteraeota bacterium]